MTPARSSGAAPFELRRFEAAPVTGAIVVVELEGRFRQPARFGRAPVLVIDPGEERARRIELQPVRMSAEGTHWQASYAVPAEALTADAQLALGVRGTLLELPAPDEPDDGERLTALAREANRLRRELEAAEADAATAREQAEAIVADRDAAVTTAREEVASAAETARAAADATLAEATLRAETAEQRATELEASLQTAEARATELETSLRAAEQRGADTETRAAEAEASVQTAEQRAADAETRATEAEASVQAAEARATELEESLQAAEVDAPLTTEMATTVDAEAMERELRVAKEGIAVLRDELAEERARSRAIAEELEAARSLDAAEPDDDEDETRVMPVAFRDDDDPTEAFSATDEADATAEQPAEPLERIGVPHTTHRERTGGVWIGRWVALAALVLFAIVLIALLFGL